MKKHLLIILVTCWSFSGFAQISGTVHSIGYTQARTTVEIDGKQITFGAIGGGLPALNQTLQVNNGASDDQIIMSGFPQPVSYFPQILDSEFFVSKGFFPDFTQLRWNVLSGEDRIRQFQIYRKPLGVAGDSLLIATLAPDEFSYQDETAELGVVFQYTIFARGIADQLRIPFVNIIQEAGFAFPSGAVSGQVNFSGGTAVEGVTVISSTEGNLRGQSVQLDGENTGLRILHGADDDELELNQGFSVQLWAKYTGTDEGVLFSKGDDYELTYDGSKLQFTVGDAVLDLAFQNPVDSFFHVSAVFEPDNELRLHALLNGVRQEKASVVAGSTPAENLSSVLFGRNAAGNSFKGFMDELRLWQTPLAEEEILLNFDRFITGREDGISGYWRLDMGIGVDFYDFARRGASFLENHGTLVNSTFSDDTPLQSQLSFKGVTDEFGNYAITGFPYETTGSLYKFTPLLPFHNFDPNQQVRFVGPGASIHNEVDFTDISSFEVSGTVLYEDSPFPVEGAGILVDGQPQVDSDGSLITTDANGTFTIEVPIGLHSVRVNMANHSFKDGGRFPVPTDDDAEPLFDFRAPVSNLSFIDQTTVKLVGRVVGGPVEQEKLFGFGLSNDNIGNATIKLTTQKKLDLTNSVTPVSETIVEENAGNTMTTQVETFTRNVTINPDTETGEYTVFLPPERFEVTSVQSGSVTFDESFNVLIDLTQAFVEETEIFEDTVSATVNGQAVPGYGPFDPDDFEVVKTAVRQDTTFTIVQDTFKLQKRIDFILRNAPEMIVTNAAGEEVFGETSFEYVDDNLGIEETISLYNENDQTYAFGHPVFRQRQAYNFIVELFEEYVNSDDGTSVDRVPVVDGKIEVINELSLSSDKVTLELNDKGKVAYGFRAGLPNRDIDQVNAANSFTRVMNITAFSGNDGAIKTIFREGDPFRGIILGSQPTGNNFVTTGPNIVDYILRDPPGSNSSASLAKGTTITRSESFTTSDTNESGESLEISYGLGITTFVGLGAGVINEVDDKASADGSFSQSTTFTNTTESTTTTTTERTISTSDDPLFVGESGDVFIGRSTNIVYGAALFLDIIPTGNCTVCGDAEVSGYKIGTRSGLNFGSQFSTGFVISQFAIENITLPNLVKVRNSFLTYAENPDVINPAEEPVYVSKIEPTDERFGSRNTDEAIWGDQATRFTNSGESYIIKYPADFDGSRADTVEFYNKQIASWEFWLAENERQKVQATLDDNVTFEAGASVTQTSTTTVTETKSFEFEFSVDSEIGAQVGLEINDIGFTAATRLSYNTTFNNNTTDTEENETTVEYTLADGDIGDSYTVDVSEPKDGFGPVFSTRGGLTACPYEPEFKTRFFEPGKHVMSAATVRREGPQVSAVENVISGVPSNRSAEFTLNLSSDSESGEDFPYNLFVDPTSNPFGAQVSVNGAPIGDGLSFLVKSGQILQQTVTIDQGRSDVFEYENIRFLLTSQCQFDPTEPQPDIADTVSVSAFFVPGCSDIEIISPKENWVVNTNTPQQDTLQVTLGGYDLNFDNFKRIQFQYREAGTASFTTDMTFYNQRKVTQQEFDDAPEPKMWVSETSITYPFSMKDLSDLEYDIRAVAFCDLGSGVVYETPTDILRGTKDTKRPQLFGAPQPADGVLSANDNISIRFNEPIAEGLLTNANFSIKGVLNNTPVDNNVSVSLDGTNDYVRIEDGVNLNGSFTLEFKLNRNDLGREMVIFSKGFVASDRLEVGFTEDNKLFIDIAGERKETAVTFTDQDQYNHYAITYDANLNEFFVYQNSDFVMERAVFTNSYSGIGPIALGRSTTENDRYLSAEVLDLRIWDRFRSLPDVFANISNVLTGSEIGLIGYWPFDEGLGTLATDRARFRNATLFAGWLVLPRGYARSFDGIDDYMEINTGATVVISDETDFTIEFWYKGVSGQKNAALFSSGRGTSGSAVENGADDPSKSLSIGFNQNGKLFVASNGQTTEIDQDSESVLDDNWHHIALSVSRIGNGSVFLDGNQVANIPRENFGAILRNRMTLGARGYNTGSTTTTQDFFFDGLIDEFRIWGSARSGQQIALNFNARQLGDEPDLLGYYPFDLPNAITGELDPDLADRAINDLGINVADAQPFGGEQSQDTPNIKPQRPVQFLVPDYIVNGDEIILNLDDRAAELVEGVTLEITVSKVEDLFENRQASPITFTAFVDRNQIVWDQNQIELQKPVNEAATFTVDVVNLGGTEERFEIINLPLWLTASPQSGSVDPQSTMPIEFTINGGLNNGYYNEDIFLTTDFGFNEELNLNVEVLEPAPDWNLNPAAFEFSMSIVANLEVNGIISRDGNDMIAAFAGSELRGVSALQYVPEFDQYMAFLDIYSNDANEAIPLEFRAFDADQGVEYRDLSPINPIFENNTTIGRPSAPQLLSTGELRAETISFEQGFSWRSFNLNTATLDKTEDLLAGIEPVTNDRVTAGGLIDIYTEGLGWLGTLTSGGGYDLDTYYLFFLQNGGEIDVTGTKADPDIEIEISPGFNRIGFIPDFFLTVDEAFSRLQPENGDIVRGQFAFAIFEEGLGWIGSLQNLQPGQGYLYFSNATDVKTLQFPDETFLSSDRAPVNLGDNEETLWEFENPWLVQVHDFPMNMSVIAELDVEEPEQFVIAAFDRDGLVGTVEPRLVNEHWLFYLSVYGNTGSKEVSFKAFDRASGKQYTISTQEVYTPNTLLGERVKPLLLEIAGLDEETSAKSIAYPNPFSDEVVIQLSKPVKNVSYEITDVDGKLIDRGSVSSDRKLRTITWRGKKADKSSVPGGMYLVRIVMEGRIDHVKVIKQ